MSKRDIAAEAASIAEVLIRWFKKADRQLPWRRTYNPYHIWISEIMLQQTQMERGVQYFLRWINRFPTVYEVAEASEQEILKYWEGLGYYARARNLHKTAKQLVMDYAGEVPCDYGKLLKLPGIGPYTAAAIASVAGNIDVAVLDANVIRVYSRFFDISQPVQKQGTKKMLSELARELLPQGRARVYNQALMDLGALICTPKKPRCHKCPLAQSCQSLAGGTVSKRPVRGAKRKTIALRKVAGLIQSRGRFFIQQRRADDLWGGLWEFPGGSIEHGDPAGQLVQRVREDCGLSVTLLRPLTRIVHQYTHNRVTLHCFLCELAGDEKEVRLQSADNSCWVSAGELDQYGFPAGPRKLLEYIRGEEPSVLEG